MKNEFAFRIIKTTGLWGEKKTSQNLKILTRTIFENKNILKMAFYGGKIDHALNTAPINR